MSPLDRHDKNLADLELGGGSGQRAPGAPPPETGETDVVDAEIDQDLPETEEELDEELDEELEEEEIARLAARAEPSGGPKPPGPWRRLYRGETSFDFVGRRRWWFTVSAVIILAGVISLGTRGLNLGIDFKGGTAWIVRTSSLTQPQAQSVVTAAGLTQPTVQVLGQGSNRTIEVQGDLNTLTTAKKKATSTAVQDALAKAAHVPATTVSVTHVGPTWGGQVTQRALEALIVFFVVVAIYISFRFEPKMALAAFVAMIHDLLITIGVYSLAGFQVTPDTVIAVLTILGYSLYDTVVVFDRVRDNTRGFGASGRMTYSEMINLSMNQTLARSINTSLVAILPVLSVLLIGAELLGATTLQDYGLALTIGLLSGAYSSIFIAAPVLAMLKEREPRYANIRHRLEARGDRIGLLTPAAAAAMVAGGGGTAAGTGQRRSGTRPGGAQGTLRPGGSKGPARPTATAGTKSAGTKSAGTKSAGTKSAGTGAGGAGAAGRSPATAATGDGVRRPPPRPRKSTGKKKRRR